MRLLLKAGADPSYSHRVQLSDLGSSLVTTDFQDASEVVTMCGVEIPHFRAGIALHFSFYFSIAAHWPTVTQVLEMPPSC